MRTHDGEIGNIQLTQVGFLQAGKRNGETLQLIALVDAIQKHEAF